MRTVWVMVLCFQRLLACAMWRPSPSRNRVSTLFGRRTGFLGRTLSSSSGALDASTSAEGYLARDLPDETVYIFDGTAMLFHAHYSRESRIAHGDTFLSESLSKELISMLNIDEEAYKLHMQELLGDAFVPGVSDGGLLHCGALTVMTMNFVRFIRELQPRYVAIAFDAGTTTFRNALYQEYKCDRKPAPMSLQPLFRLAPLVMEELGCRCFQMHGYEADDVMASLSDWGRSKGLNVVHVSVDKDMLQLIDTGVHVLNPYAKGRRVMGPEDVMEKFAVSPENLIDYQALAGDASDGIPGVKGIGPKAGAAILQHFESIETLIEKLKIPTNPVDFESLESIEENGLVVDEKLTARKQKAAAKAIEKAALEGKKCSQSTERIYVQIPQEIKSEIDICLLDERLGTSSLYESLLACGSKQLLLYKQLVTLDRNLDVGSTLYDRTKPNLFTINEELVSENPLLSVEKIALKIGEEKKPYEDEDGVPLAEIDESDFSTTQVRYVGERSPLAADVLVGISSSLGTPLNLLRQIYSRLDRAQ